MKKVLLLVFMLIFLVGCGKNENELIMVTEAGFAPYEYYDNGEIVGVDVDIARDIAKELNKELVLKDVDFGSIINELNSGKADFAAAGMSIDEERKCMTIIFDDERKVVYDYNFLDELDLAYATTIHKSQGSEFKVVIIPVFMGSPFLMNRNLLYTGITRAKQLVVVVGFQKALMYMINNTNSMERHSALKYRIRDIISQDEIEHDEFLKDEDELDAEFLKGLEEFNKDNDKI